MAAFFGDPFLQPTEVPGSRRCPPFDPEWTARRVRTPPTTGGGRAKSPYFGGAAISSASTLPPARRHREPVVAERHDQPEPYLQADVLLPVDLGPLPYPGAVEVHPERLDAAVLELQPPAEASPAQPPPATAPGERQPSGPGQHHRLHRAGPRVPGGAPQRLATCWEEAASGETGAPSASRTDSRESREATMRRSWTST